MGGDRDKLVELASCAWVMTNEYRDPGDVVYRHITEIAERQAKNADQLAAELTEAWNDGSFLEYRAKLDACRQLLSVQNGLVYHCRDVSVPIDDILGMSVSPSKTAKRIMARLVDIRKKKDVNPRAYLASLKVEGKDHVLDAPNDALDHVNGGVPAQKHEVQGRFAYTRSKSGDHTGKILCMFSMLTRMNTRLSTESM